MLAFVKEGRRLIEEEGCVALVTSCGVSRARSYPQQGEGEIVASLPSLPDRVLRAFRL